MANWLEYAPSEGAQKLTAIDRLSLGRRPKLLVKQEKNLLSWSGKFLADRLALSLLIWTVKAFELTLVSKKEEWQSSAGEAKKSKFGWLGNLVDGQGSVFLGGHVFYVTISAEIFLVRFWWIKGFASKMEGFIGRLDFWLNFNAI